MKPIISVEGLGKRYTIRHEGRERYRSLREEIFQLPKRLWQRSQESKEDFWALRDVTFDIMPGDRVGIIGRNGAGKSTLLKLLSRITEPTTGRITLRGRVASLLEVGTGFHPELTGRENIYLNGAILGMSRAEVRRKFDEIVDFAGVEQFLDTPVKRYSSGMYVRLAFAVAAHLEPEILIVDEVLAVGDAEFQKKCLGKMEEVGKEGRTVLFVSHNMQSITKLCTSGIILYNGSITYKSDKIDEVILNVSEPTKNNKWINNNINHKLITPLYMSIINKSYEEIYNVIFSEKASLRIIIKISNDIHELDLFYRIKNTNGVCIYDGNIREYNTSVLNKGVYEIITELPLMNINIGLYYIYLCATIKNTEWLFDETNGPCIKFNIYQNKKDINYWELNKKCILFKLILLTYVKIRVQTVLDFVDIIENHILWIIIISN